MKKSQAANFLLQRYDVVDNDNAQRNAKPIEITESQHNSEIVSVLSMLSSNLDVINERLILLDIKISDLMKKRPNENL